MPQERLKDLEGYKHLKKYEESNWRQQTMRAIRNMTAETKKYLERLKLHSIERR